MSQKGNRFELKHNRYLGSVPDKGRVIVEKLEYNPTQKQIAYYNRLQKKCAKYDCEKPKQPTTRSEYSDAIDFYKELLERNAKNSTKNNSASLKEKEELLTLFNEMTSAQRIRFIAYAEGMLGKTINEKTADKRRNKKIS